jgi:FixJ family two-component response regulator
MTSLQSDRADDLTGFRGAGGRDTWGRGMMETLAPREELVLRLRFGRVRATRTRQQVAQLLRVSDATVQRIEQQALRKLRLSALGPITGGWQGWDEV